MNIKTKKRIWFPIKREEQVKKLLLLVSLAACILGLSLAWAKEGQNMDSKTGPAEFSSIDRYVAAEMKRLEVPGLALAIIKGDRVFHTKCFGEADSTGRPVTPQTPFYIGSISKSFTALAVMQLVDAGKINLDDPVKKYLPWFELADRKASASITVRQLLNQVSGISGFEGNRYWPEDRSLEETIRGMGNVQLAYPVGKKYEYSNINYGIAGMIVEQVSGEKFNEYLRRHIFEPLDMHHSFSSRERALADGVAQGHYYMFRHPFARLASLPPVYLPSGLLISSVEDMTHYLVAQMNDGKYRGVSIVSPEALKTMHEGVNKMPNRPMHYGMGWASGSFEGEPMIMHNGDLGYFHASAFMLPKSGLGVVALANSSGFEQISQIDELSENVIRLLKGEKSIPVSMPIGMSSIYWAIVLMPLFLLAGIAYGLVRWYGGSGFASWQVWVVVPVYLAVAGMSLFKLPGLIPFSLSSMRIFYPELAYALITNGILGIGWSIAFVVLMLLQRK